MTERAPGVWTLRAWDPVNKDRRPAITFKGSKTAAGKALAAHVTDVQRKARKQEKRSKKADDAHTVADAFRAWADKGDLEGSSIVHARYSLQYLGSLGSLGRP